MRAALYARVSTENHGQNPDMQLNELKEYAVLRAWSIAGIYCDVGVSGSKASRPELNRLMSDAQRRKFDVLLCWKLDRFGRSLAHLVTAIAELTGWGVQFVSLRDNLDLTTPSGRLMFHVIAAMAEFERELICERVKAGMKAAKARGSKIGNAPLIDKAPILQLKAEGMTNRAIARALGVSHQSVNRIVNLFDCQAKA